ncbi:MAG: diguanylate cyclase [Natronospirillum sp.]
MSVHLPARRSPLAKRLFLLSFPGIAIVLLLLQLLSGWFQYRQLQENLETQANAIARLTAAAIAQPLWVFDRQIYEAQVRAIGIDDQFIYARILDEAGEVIFFHGDEERGITSHDRDILVLRLPVLEPFSEREFAQFELTWSTASLHQIVRQTVLMGVVLFALTLVSLYVVTQSVVQRWILSPLATLIDALSRVERKEWTKLPVTDKTEWAAVFEAFNGMTDGLQSGDEARRYLDQLRVAEAELREQHEATQLLSERLGLATQAGHIGIWDYDVYTGTRTWNDEMYSLYHLPAGEVEREPLAWERALHPDDRADAIARTKQALAGEEGLEDEYRIVRGDGEVRWIKTQGRVLRDEAGEPMRFLGTNIDITHLKEQEAALQKMAHYDALTGLPNRRLLADRMEQAIVYSEHHDTLLAIALMDLDGFKEVNDGLGHDVGDRLLTILGQRLERCIRQGDTLARLGGDEFVFLLCELNSREEVERALQRIMDALQQPIVVGEESLSVSTSIGVTIYPQDPSTDDTLLRHADEALYAAKRAGKNCYRFYGDSEFP